MDSSHIVQTNLEDVSQGGEEVPLSHEFQQLLESLPKERGWRTAHLYKYQSFWYSTKELEANLAAQKHFQAHDTDIILVTSPKSGTTWLKSLVFAIVKRTHYPVSYQNHPLVTTNPHGLVPFLEILYRNRQIPDISSLPFPRMFSTHVNYSMLPESVRNSNCRIIYLCRNPKDIFISLWLFNNKLAPSTLEKLSLEEAFEKFCNGVSAFGPFWDQALGYWKMSLEMPAKVLFLRYEDMKEDITSQISSMAEFLNFPFSVKEENVGIVEEIAKMCSFEHLSNLKVNKANGARSISFVENKDFFRKGKVGDWINYLTPSMVERIDQIISQKLEGSGLTFM